MATSGVSNINPSTSFHESVSKDKTTQTRSALSDIFRSVADITSEDTGETSGGSRTAYEKTREADRKELSNALGLNLPGQNFFLLT